MKQPHQMTHDELLAEVKRLQKAEAENAKLRKQVERANGMWTEVDAAAERWKERCEAADDRAEKAEAALARLQETYGALLQLEDLHARHSDEFARQAGDAEAALADEIVRADKFQAVLDKVEGAYAELVMKLEMQKPANVAMQEGLNIIRLHKAEAEVERLRAFNESGLTCSKHWRHPSQCCKGRYTTYYVSELGKRSNEENEAALRAIWAEGHADDCRVCPSCDCHRRHVPERLRKTYTMSDAQQDIAETTGELRGKEGS